MDIVKIGAELLIKQLGLDIDPNTVVTALSGLLGDGSGSIDLAGLASKMAASGELSSIVGSWLGDGANQAISADKVLGMLGDSKLADFAGTLGTSTDAAAGGLAEVLPQLLDQSSSGGSLLDAVGGTEGLMGLAKSLF